MTVTAMKSPFMITLYHEFLNLSSKKKKTENKIALCLAFLFTCDQTERVTFPERKQRVQTYTDFGVPFTIARTFLTFAFHVLFDLLCEWLTLIPKDTPFPQISHFAI